ncbi:MAG: AAA family ATPase [Spirochaetales bacterium]|nr:AAA family ATPase [Spirochaetales bacterium]
MDLASEQAKILDALQGRGDLLCRGTGEVESIRRVETHISIVLIGHDLVFKYKKLVAFPFITQDTLQRQLQNCQAEVTLNRELAPEVYLGVFDLIWQEGRLHLVQWQGGGVNCPGVLMQRLPEKDSLKHLSGHPAFFTEYEKQLVRLAEKLALFHRERAKNKFTASQFIKNYNDNLVLMQGSPQLKGDLLKRISALLDRHRPWIERRMRAGHVIAGHGDLRLDHIYFSSDEPVIIDCIEFNPELSLVDPYEDLAFLTLGLQMEQQHRAARILSASYASFSLDAGGYNLLPLFEVYRACVRIKIDLIQSQTASAPRQAELSERIARYQVLIEQCLAVQASPPQRKMHVFYGLPATGKSTRAEDCRRSEGLPVVSTDRLRKKMLGLQSSVRARPEDYNLSVSNRVYRRQAALARQFLHSGGVILDGVFGRRAERSRVSKLAQRVAADLAWNYCEASTTEIEKRLARRRENPGVSDLTDFETWQMIKDRFEE